MWKTADADGNGVLSKAEFPKFTPAFWFDVADLDVNGSLTKDEWAYYRAALDSENGMLAIRLGGSGDMTRQGDPLEVPAQRAAAALAAAVSAACSTWSTTTASSRRSIRRPARVIKQGRLTGAPGPYFASPIAADGHIFFTTEAGAVVVVAPGGDLTPMAVNDLDEDTYATPAFADGRIYVRTTRRLYAFGTN